MTAYRFGRNIIRCPLNEQVDGPKPSNTCYFTIQPIPSGWVIMGVRRVIDAVRDAICSGIEPRMTRIARMEICYGYP
jgi:hypothetical protein